MYMALAILKQVIQADICMHFDQSILYCNIILMPLLAVLLSPQQNVTHITKIDSKKREIICEIMDNVS